MENQPELIRDQMQDTRTALTEKLEKLEAKVTDTVQSATSSVTETVESVKEVVQDTVETVSETVSTVADSAQQAVNSVKQAFDVRLYVERYPVATMLGSVAVGYFVGRMLHGLGGSPPSPPGQSGQTLGSFLPSGKKANGHARPHRETNGHDKEQAKDSDQGWLAGLADAYSDEIKQLQGLGVAAVTGVLRDMVTQAVPGEIGSRLHEWVNGLTRKMGADPLEEPLVETPSNEPSAHDPLQDQEHEHKKSRKGQHHRGSLRS